MTAQNNDRPKDDRGIAKALVKKGVDEMEKRCSDTEQHCSCTGFALGFVEDDIANAISQARLETAKELLGAVEKTGMCNVHNYKKGDDFMACREKALEALTAKCRELGIDLNQLTGE